MRWRAIDLIWLVLYVFLFLLVSGKGYGLLLWHSLDFSLTFFYIPFERRTPAGFGAFFNRLILKSIGMSLLVGG